MKIGHVGIARRTFLKGLGLTVGGLALGVFPELAEAENREGFRPNVFLHIDANGVVTIVCSKSEMGQGVRSSLPVLVADELGADLSTIKILQGDWDPAYGEQGTDGSTSARTLYLPLRLCGASARSMLVTVAAKRWQVPSEECDTRGGFVHHGASQRKLAFAALVAEAATLPVPAPATVVLRPKAQLQYIGREGLPLVDAPDVVRGSAVFAADVRVPGMLVATIERPPVVGGRVQSLDATGALAIPGVRKVVTLPSVTAPVAFKPLGGVAVIADNTWAALRGRAALKIGWEGGANKGYDSGLHRDELLRTVRNPGKMIREHGDVDAALTGAARRVTGEYFVPHLAHTPMEPVCALARFVDGACELWVCTQAPKDVANQVAETLGIEATAVTVHVTLLGGGFGRKSKPDYAAEAAWLSREIGAPVRVQWTREDDIRHDYFHAISAQRLEAAIDASGNVVGFLHRTAFPSLMSTFQNNVTTATPSELSLGVLDLPFPIPSFRAEVGTAIPHVRIGWLRSVSNIHHGFAVGCFLDEVATARNMDARDSLLDILGPPRKLTAASDFGAAQMPNYGETLTRYPVDVGRYRGVVERVTAMSRWHQKNGRALGLAVHRSFLSYVAVVISVIRAADGSIRVDDAWAAGDMGTVVNPERVRTQLEGSIIFGMNLAFHGGVSVRNGAVVESNFRDLRLLRCAEAPRRIHVELVENDELPGGAGEPGVPPVAAALCNAIFALTGQRIRELPIADHRC